MPRLKTNRIIVQKRTDSNNYFISIPKRIVEECDLKAGVVIEFEKTHCGDIVLKRVRSLS